MKKSKKIMSLDLPQLKKYCDNGGFRAFAYDADNQYDLNSEDGDFVVLFDKVDISEKENSVSFSSGRNKIVLHNVSYVTVDYTSRFVGSIINLVYGVTDIKQMVILAM